jgi:hypothetical protein
VEKGWELVELHGLWWAYRGELPPSEAFTTHGRSHHSAIRAPYPSRVIGRSAPFADIQALLKYGNCGTEARSNALCVFVILLLQSCAVGVGGSLGKSETLSQGAAIGLMLAFMYVLGAAFASGVPLVSTVVFAFGALAQFQPELKPGVSPT